MPTASYHQVGDPDHDPGVIKDTGCEVSPTCVHCPLSRCKWDDLKWFRNGIRRGADFLVANAIDREGLSLAQAGVRFRTTKRTIARIRQRCRQVPNTLTAQDIAVFTRLAHCTAAGEPANLGERREGSVGWPVAENHTPERVVEAGLPVWSTLFEVVHDVGVQL